MEKYLIKLQKVLKLPDYTQINTCSFETIDDSLISFISLKSLMS
jgi:hypothetical protein